MKTNKDLLDWINESGSIDRFIKALEGQYITLGMIWENDEETDHIITLQELKDYKKEKEGE